MLVELMLKNLKAHSKRYFVYLASLTFVVMIAYCFIAVSQQGIPGAEKVTEVNLNSAFFGASLVMFLFVYAFMSQVNHFFIQQRRKEMGIYNLLGMHKWQIVMLFGIENVAIGLISLGFGLLFGIVFSKLFSMILLKVMFVSAKTSFLVSKGAISLTAVGFLGILFILTIKNTQMVYKAQLVTLLGYRGKKLNDPLKVSMLTHIVGFFGVVLLFTGYALAWNYLKVIKQLSMNSDQTIDVAPMIWLPLFILIVVILGTYLFFYSFLPIVLKIVQKYSHHYYRDMTMIMVGNLKYHVKRNARFLGTVATICGTGASFIIGAAFLYSQTMYSVNGVTPMDVTMTSPHISVAKKIINQEGLDTKNKISLTLKTVVSISSVKQKGKKINSADHLTDVLSWSNYQQAAKQNNYLSYLQPLKNNECYLLVPSQFMDSADLYQYEDQIEIASNRKLLKIKERKTNYIGNDTRNYLGYTLVVPDNFFEEMPSNEKRQVYQWNFTNEKDNQVFIKQLKQRLPIKPDYFLSYKTAQGKIVQDVQQNTTDDQKFGAIYNYDLRLPLLQKNREEMGLFMYVAVFLGVILLTATGSILLLKELSHAEDEQNQYALLRALGIPEDKIHQSIYKQIFFVFFVPMLIAVLDAIFANSISNGLLSVQGYHLAFFVGICLLAFYFIFYLLTVRAYIKIIKQ